MYDITFLDKIMNKGFVIETFMIYPDKINLVDF